MEKRSCIIVGAGPAGLAAAIAAARSGCSVVLLEKNARPGRKLLLTGGGRANLTDPASPALDALEAYGRSGRFLRQALASFSLAEFLKELGVETERELDGPRRGSLYVCGGARRLLEALRTEAAHRGVEAVYGAAVRTAARRPDGGFEVRSERSADPYGSERSADPYGSARGNWTGRRLIIATGGLTYPSTGSSGDGYRLAGIFGHEVEAPRPALGALATDPSFPSMAGTSVADASVTLRRDGRRLATRRGALLFTHHGVSGPPALDLSLELARASPSPEEAPGARLVVDLAPDRTREQVLEEFLALSRARPQRRLENAGLCPGGAGLSATLSARLVAELARLAGIDPARRLGRISRCELGTLAGNVKALAMTVREPLDPNEAMVTLGGVATKRLDPYTMESRLVPGLRFAGEVLAPAGPCGGYNLLMAFATGQVAGHRPDASPS